jgi:NADPH-dependent curcumin reductase CurA
MQGFLYFDYVNEFPQAIKELQNLIKQGKLKFRVDIQNGIE